MANMLTEIREATRIKTQIKRTAAAAAVAAITATTTITESIPPLLLKAESMLQGHEQHLGAD
jgi:hypothetical protein